MLKLLVPIDGSDCSKRSIDWIRERYQPSEVSLTLLFVREDWDDIRSKEQYELGKIVPELQAKHK